MRAGRPARRHIVRQRHRHRIAGFEPQRRPVLQSVQTRRVHVHVVTSQLHLHADGGVLVRVLRHRDGRRQRAVFYENMCEYVLRAFLKKMYFVLLFNFKVLQFRARKTETEREVRIDRQSDGQKEETHPSFRRFARLAFALFFSGCKREKI